MSLSIINPTYMYKFNDDVINEAFDFVEAKNKRDLQLLSKVDKKGYLKKLKDAEDEQDKYVIEQVQNKYKELKDAPISERKKQELSLQAGINEKKLQKLQYSKRYNVKNKPKRKRKTKNKNVK